MSKKQLLDVAERMRSLADSIQKLAETITADDPSEAAAAEPKPVAKAVTLEQVRAVLAEKSQNGFTAEVRVLLEKHGAAKLSQIDPANYAALLADAEGLK